MNKHALVESLSKTINVAQLMEFLSQFDGRFPVCFKDNKKNMIPLNKEDISMSNVNVLLPNHTHIFGISAVVIKTP